MFIVIRPDCVDRPPTIDFFRSFKPSEKEKLIKVVKEQDFVVKFFKTLDELKTILKKTNCTSKYLFRKMNKVTNSPTKNWYLECLDTTYIITNKKVKCTQLFKSWGLKEILCVTKKGELELV